MHTSQNDTLPQQKKEQVKEEFNIIAYHLEYNNYTAYYNKSQSVGRHFCINKDYKSSSFVVFNSFTKVHTKSNMPLLEYNTRM